MARPRGWSGRDGLSIRRGASFVYFIQSGRGGPIKVGYSTDPSRRVEALRHEREDPTLKVCRVVEVHESKVREMEAGIHAHFATVRLAGEWFHPVAELAKLGHCLPETDGEARARRRERAFVQALIPTF